MEPLNAWDATNEPDPNVVLVASKDVERTYLHSDLKMIRHAKSAVQKGARVTSTNSIVSDEDSSTKSGGVLPDDSCPLTDYDVICGRSKSAFNNIGNRRFRIIISLFLPRYLKTKSRVDRSKLINEIVDTVHSAGGQFLKELPDWDLHEVEPKEGRNKVGHALRDAASAFHRKK